MPFKAAYKQSFRDEVASYSMKHGITKAMKKYGVSYNAIRKWMADVNRAVDTTLEHLAKEQLIEEAVPYEETIPVSAIKWVVMGYKIGLADRDV